MCTGKLQLFQDLLVWVELLSCWKYGDNNNNIKVLHDLPLSSQQYSFVWHCGAAVSISLQSLFGFVCAGLVGLMNKNMVSSLISKYAQVVLWFCRTGLLPEGSGIFYWLHLLCLRIIIFLIPLRIDMWSKCIWFWDILALNLLPLTP